MRPINLKEWNEEQLWEYVAVHLEKNGAKQVAILTKSTLKGTLW